MYSRAGLAAALMVALLAPGAAAQEPLQGEQMERKSNERSTGDAAQQPVELHPAPASRSAVAQDFRYRINVPGDGQWATIRNTTNGYTLGNGNDGPNNASSAWTFDVTYRSSDFVYYYGHLYGNYNGCGWIYASNLDSKDGTPRHLCSGSGTNIPLSSFASSVNSRPQGDGRETFTTCATEAWANIRPTSTTPTPTGIVRTYAAGKRLLWRYVNRHGGQYVLVRDPDLGSNEGFGSWVFVRRACLPASLPDAQPGS